MTAAPNSTLVERVITALCVAEGHDPAYTPAREANRKKAQAALAACEAEELREVLGLLVYAKEMKERAGNSPAYQAKKDEGWTRARALLARLDAKAAS